MKSGGPWNLRGLRPEAREAARAAARRSGLSVGEWLNTVIQPTEADDDETWRSEDVNRGADDDRELRRRPDANWRRSQGGPYRVSPPERANQSRREQQHYYERATRPASESYRDVSIDQAVAEIMARQRVLAGEPAGEPAFTEPSRAPPISPPPPISPSPELTNLEQQLRQITTRIEALRPSDVEAAISTLRADLAEIGRSLTEALPRRAVESLEIEIKALAQRIDHSRQTGVDANALAGLEHGLAEVRDALRALTPAESLVGFEEAVTALSKKVDAIVARDDPDALQQLETAIGALRGIVSHVASNDTLTKLAEDVRALAAKVDGLANSATSFPSLSALEARIDQLAAAVTASTEAGHAVPRELEKLFSGLIEKFEWAQLTHSDHTALAHLEDRIAMLVKRLDASDARLGQLEGVERGLADLLVYINELRGVSGGESSAKRPVAVDAIEHKVAEIKETERRTQDSLEAVQGTVEHVVDRLAMIESDMRGDKAPVTPAEDDVALGALSPDLAPAHDDERHGDSPTEPSPSQAQMPAAAPLTPPEPPPEPAAPPAAADVAAAPKPMEPEGAPRRVAAVRPPIDPNLPPDHPLEPGSASARSRMQPSAADRIAASEAAAGSKPPVIPDPGGRPNFIAAARRAAQTAASELPNGRSSSSRKQPKKLTERMRMLAVVASVVIIVIGCLHIASRLFEDGGSAGPTHAPTAPPVVLPEMPSAPAAGAEGTPAAHPKVIQVPSPDADPGQNTSAPPPSSSPKPGATTGRAPGPQSLLDLTVEPPAATASALPEPEKAPAPVTSTVSTAMPAWAADVTGALPSPSAPQQQALGPGPAAGDKLPTAIGPPTLRTAALAGDPAAAYEVGVRFAEGRGVPQNNEEAARWLERAAKQGLAPAQFRLGTFYEKGLGVKKNLAVARDLYRAAADKGQGKAMHNLAVLYAEGAEGTADYRTAAHWFRKAADRGITDSQYNLAILYARGVGVEQNFTEAYRWFSLAAKDGDKDAAKKRDEVAARLDEQSLAAARLAIEKWTPVPQPAEVTAVKIPAAWNAPAAGTPASKAKPRPAAKAAANTATKSFAADAAKVD